VIDLSPTRLRFGLYDYDVCVVRNRPCPPLEHDSCNLCARPSYNMASRVTVKVPWTVRRVRPALDHEARCSYHCGWDSGDFVFREDPLELGKHAGCVKKI